MNEAVVKNSDYVFHIDLGTCASVVLCGMDDKSKIWIGINHLFKAREKNSDVSFRQVAELVNRLKEQRAEKIRCLGLFGAGYQEKSLARHVAQKNILTIVEALSLFDLSIEVFETGYNQAVSILMSDRRNSFMIMHQKLGEQEKKVIEIPLSKLFG